METNKNDAQIIFYLTSPIIEFEYFLVHAYERMTWIDYLGKIIIEYLGMKKVLILITRLQFFYFFLLIGCIVSMKIKFLKSLRYKIIFINIF